VGVRNGALMMDHKENCDNGSTGGWSEMLVTLARHENVESDSVASARC
jgi:hypothetical protein